MGESVGLGGKAGAGTGTVTVDDLALFTGRLSSGALASFEATRFATGRKNALEIEISVSVGVATFDGSNHADPEALMQAADEKLYAAKSGGRDRIDG